jgi:hypothetical protein
MTGWPILLPAAVFSLLCVTFLGVEATDPADGEAWRRAFVKAALLCGVFVTASTEVLGAFRALTASGLLVTWSLALLASGIACWRVRGWAHLRRWVKGEKWRVSLPDVATLVGLAVLVIVAALVAWVSPANTTDSHLYHMARVVHWAQNRSLAHYPTTYEHQLWFPPWAETAILTLRLLWGNDQPAGLVQWACYVGSLVLAAGIAGQLGAGRRGRLLASAFCASIPMAVLQATSTQNDLTAAFWLLCFAYLLLLSSARRWRIDHSIALGMALGLGILTKTTFYVYAFPFVVWSLVRTWRDEGWRCSLLSGGVMGLSAGLLNAGYWGRNLITYGSPIGPSELVQSHTAFGSAAALAVGWAKHLLTHFATPSEAANRWIETAFRSLTSWLPQTAAEFHLTWSWNHEDLAGSPGHIIAIGVVLFLLIVLRRRPRQPNLAFYAVAGVGGIVLLSTFIAWNPYVVRLHLPFLVVMAPLVGAVVDSWLRPGWMAVLSGVLLLLGLPWLLLNQTRPVIGLRPRTAIVSVFEAEKVDILFANWLPLRDDFIAATDAVKASGCTQVGLRIDSHDLEYPFWWLLDAPQSGTRLEHIDPYPHLLRYADPDFRPCAILCTICEGRGTLYGLDRVGVFGAITVFGGNAYQR